MSHPKHPMHDAVVARLTTQPALFRLTTPFLVRDVRRLFPLGLKAAWSAVADARKAVA